MDVQPGNPSLEEEVQWSNIRAIREELKATGFFSSANRCVTALTLCLSSENGE